MKNILSPALLTFAAYIISFNNEEEKNSRKEMAGEQNKVKEDAAKTADDTDY